MNRYQKEAIKKSLQEEKEVLQSLKGEYEEARKRVNQKIKELLARNDENSPNVIRQIKYQRYIKQQIDETLFNFETQEYNTINKYLNDSYITGFTASLYVLQKQNIPLIFPIDKNEMIKAVQLNSKISEGLYNRLKIDTNDLKKAIRSEITRGISSSMTYADIARNINNRMNTGLKNAYRIARTEGHRITQEAKLDLIRKEKKAGADVVKQWDSTLDDRTRPHHSQLHGQIREVEEPFEIAGRKAMYPGGFGLPSEDINCRCVLVSVGRWEIENSKLDQTDGLISDLSNSKNIDEFRDKFETEVNKINVYGGYTGAYSNLNDESGEKRNKHAHMYYDEIRNRNPKTVINNITRNTGFKKDDVRIVINHVFFNKYDIYNDGILRNFEPSYEMSVCFQRMGSRQKLKNADKILFRHELMEAKLMMKGMSFEKAHELAQSKYNFKAITTKWQKGEKID